MKKLIAAVLILIALALLLSDFDGESTNTAYVLGIIAVKLVGFTLGWIGVTILTTKTT